MGQLEPPVMEQRLQNAGKTMDPAAGSQDGRRMKSLAEKGETANDAMEGAQAVSSFFGEYVDPNTVAQLGLGAISIIANCASAMPFLAPLGPILKGFTDAVRGAQYNAEAVDALKARVDEILNVLKDLLPRLEKHSNIDGLLEPLCKAIEDCAKFVNEFCQKGFLKKMFSSGMDKEKLRKLDKKLTDSLQTINTGVGSAQLDLQEQSLDKMKKMEEMMEQLLKAGGNNASAAPEQIDPQVLADIVAKAGADSADAIQGELQGVGLKLEEIGDAVNQALGKLDMIDEKLDRQHEQQMQAHAEAREMQEQNRDLLMNATAEAKKAQDKTLAAVMALAEKNGAVVINWSTKREVREMSSRAKQMLSGGVPFDVIHAHGVGTEEWVDLDGEPGEDGEDGESYFQAAGTRDGHGEHGEDGLDGSHGLDGTNGEFAENYDVMIEFLSEDTAAGTRTYRIEHAGVKGADEHEVTIKFPEGRLLVDGTGGQGGGGGRGGNGGNGQAGGPGENGGDGGDGGDGGHPDLGGAGGNGGHGAAIRINTNDPAVLMLLDIDCTGGEAGREGQDGDVGRGGAGGEGGAPPPPPIITNADGSTIEMPTSPATMRAGRMGKAGKDAKKARRGAKADGTAGQDGKFTICAYDEDGNFESGGRPYRLMFAKGDDKLKAVPFTLGQADESGPMVYGQHIKIGPTKPVNTGGLASPPSQLTATVMARCNGEDCLVTGGALNFPTVPAAKGTRNGELPKAAASTLTLQLPAAGPPFLPPIDGSFPFQFYPAAVPDKTVLTEFRWTVDGLPFRRVAEDNDMTSVMRQQNQLIFPLRFGDVSSFPATLALEHDTSSSFSLDVVNRLKTPHSSADGYELVLSCAGFGFMVGVTAQQQPPLTTSAALEPSNGWHFATFRQPIPSLGADDSKTLNFSISMPPGTTARPGAYLVIRPELGVKGTSFVAAPPACIRLCPPPPGPGEVGPKDVVVFSTEAMRIEDYDIVQQAVEFQGGKASFVDVHRFAEGGSVQRKTWQTYHGKATVVWAPHAPNLEGMVPPADLEQHLAQGGALVTTSPLFRGQDWQHSRKVVADARGVSVGLTATDTQVAIDNTAVGSHIWPLVSALLDVQSTSEKLQLYASGSAILKAKIGSWSAEQFETDVVVKKSGWFCCRKTEFVNTAVSQGSSALLVEDYLLCAVAREVQADLPQLQQGQADGCMALGALKTFLGTAAGDDRLASAGCALLEEVKNSAPTHLIKKKQATDPVSMWVNQVESQSAALENRLNGGKVTGISASKRVKSARQQVDSGRSQDEDPNRAAALRSAVESKVNVLRGFDASKYTANGAASAVETPDFLGERDLLQPPLPRVRVGRAGLPASNTKDVASVVSSKSSASKAASAFKRGLASGGTDTPGGTVDSPGGTVDSPGGTDSVPGTPSTPSKTPSTRMSGLFSAAKASVSSSLAFGGGKMSV